MYDVNVLIGAHSTFYEGSRALLLCSMAERSMLDNLQKFEEQLTCSVCLNIYKNPKGLPCQHSFCYDCLRSIGVYRQGDEHFLECPLCRKPAHVPHADFSSLPPAFVINSLVELHRRMTSRQCATECALHNRLLEGYCISCQELVCFACATQSHRAHDYHLLSDIVGNCRQELEEGIESVKQMLAAVTRTISTLSACDEQIVRCGEEVEQEIRSLAREVRAAVDRKEAELVEEVRTAVLLKRGMVMLQRNEAQREMARLQSSVDFVKQKLEVCSDEQIVVSKQEILKCVKESIDRVTVTNLRTMEKADITFDRNPKVMEDCGNIGSLRKLQFNYKCILSCLPVLSGERAHGELTLLHSDGYPLSISPSLISCQASSCSNLRLLDCTIQEAGAGRFLFSFVPFSRDLHQLRVLFRGKEIPGSVFTVSLMPSIPQAKGRLLAAIKGLQYPVDVATSKHGQVVVSDRNAHCIVLFNSNLKRVWAVGSQGSASDQFNNPNGVAITDDNCIVVADSLNHRLQVLSMEAHFLKSVRKPGSLPFDYPIGVAVHSGGYILVSEFHGKRIQVLRKDFSFFQVIPFNVSVSTNGIVPYCIAEHQGVIYVTDYCNSQIIKMSPSGVVLAKFGGKGANEGQLCRPVGLAIDAEGFVYVCERKNHRISVFTKDGKFFRCFAAKSESGMNSPRGLAVDNTGKLYACDSFNKRVVIF